VENTRRWGVTEGDKWFSNKVCIMRKERNISQNDLAFLTGMSRGMIAHIETGNQQVYLWQAIRLAKILGINLMKMPLDGIDEVL
jgi:transcriptional regulator with XRE-family HTH domain